jgi:uncharacterized repeat protein (TIGR02543 family)
MFVSVAVLMLFSAVAAHAQTAITPGTPVSDATIHCIAIEWLCTGDTDHDATCTTEYREEGSGTWLNALPLLRVDQDNHNGFSGSIFYLDPDTDYEILVTISDPDGGGTSTTLHDVPTRAVPAMPTGGTTYHVIPGSGGGDGSSGNPFQGTAAAEAVAAPGDIFLLHAGDYNVVNLTEAGTTNNWIVWKAAGDGDAVINGMTVKDWVWIHGLYFLTGAGEPVIEDEYYTSYGYTSGLTMTDATSVDNICVTRCTFRGFSYSIRAKGGCDYWYIADNDIRGDIDDPKTWYKGGEGVELKKSTGSIVCYNRIKRCADGVSYPYKHCDIYGNDIQDTSDDGIEPDYGRHNNRIWGNRITNTLMWTFTFQPMGCGPWYFFRNQVVNSQGNIWKAGDGGHMDDRWFAAHNTFIFPQMAWYFGQCVLNAVHKNNLYIGYTSTQELWRGYWAGGEEENGPGLSETAFWMTDVDYDGFDWDGKTYPFTWFDTNYSNLTSFASAVGIESHGIVVDRTEIFENWATPSTVLDHTPVHMELASGANVAVDAGAILYNINDGYLGDAPDLGCLERGASLPHYGPRLVGSTYTLTVTSGTGDGSYNQSALVDISADDPQQGDMFDEWTGDVQYVNDPESADTFVTMPAWNVTVTATYTSAATYTLTVTSGSGDGSYDEDEVVNISADTPPTSYEFDVWTGDTSYVANVNLSSTTVTMPASNVSITATYELSGDGAFIESSGMVVMEAEHYTDKIAGSGAYSDHYWTEEADTEAINGYMMSCMPNDDTYATSGTDSPRIDWEVNFSTTGVYYLLIRQPPELSPDNKTGYGMDGTYLNYFGADASTWRWPKGGTALNVTSTGYHTVNIFMREDGFSVDRVLLTTNSGYTLDPGVEGPPESSREGGDTYTLTVTSGSGDGDYEEDEQVGITADSPAANYHFDDWTGDTAYVANVNSASTTVTMPASNVTVTATYDEDPEYTLTVTSGTGDGTYYEDEEPDITADSPQSGYVFDAWTGDTAYVANVNSASTTVTMPAQNVSVTATYSPTGGSGAFIESSGQVVMECENYTDSQAGTGSADGKTWQLNTGISGDSGDCMQPLPNTGVNVGDTGTNGPRMDYQINFSTTGVYYILLRMPAQISGADDSTNVGMDAAIVQGQLANSEGAWAWRKAANTKTISSTGYHTFNIWMREDGVIVDKVVLTTNSSYAPVGSNTGPAESSRESGTTYTLTVTSGSGDGDYEEDEQVGITADSPASGYTFDEWTGDTDNVANVNSASTTVTMPASNVSVTATYKVLAFVESGGMVVMEAEHYTDKIAGSGAYSDHYWTEEADTEAINGYMMSCMPNDDTYATSGTDSPRIDWKVNFSTTGVYYLLIRQPPELSPDNKTGYGMDGTYVNYFGADASTWRWPKGGTALNVTSTGYHTVNIFMREDGFSVDRVLLTTNSSYSLDPGEEGPAESSME